VGQRRRPLALLRRGDGPLADAVDKGRVLDDDGAVALALEVARQGAAEGEQPYGAVVVDAEGRVVATAHDEVAARRDPTAHSELLAVQRAVASRGPDLSGCSLVCTIEPCAMCFQAAWWARMSRLVFGASMRELVALHPEVIEEVVIDSASLNEIAQRRLVLVAGVRRRECLDLWGNRQKL
jgi:tRNA(adenine34) deaminase